MIQVTEEVQKLIDEYNRCALLSTFFYEHPECTAQLAKQLKVKLEDVLEAMDFVNNDTQDIKGGRIIDDSSSGYC